MCSAVFLKLCYVYYQGVLDAPSGGTLDDLD